MPAAQDADIAPHLSALDQQILELVSRLRIVTQTQLERLHSDVPERTLRYRTRRLQSLRLLGRSRPYRTRGSAPNHWWPTNRADALVRGQPPPRRGERQEPSPLFLAHTAAVSELYVVLHARAADAGLDLADFRREGEARQDFTDAAGRRRAIAPDAGIGLRDATGRLWRGHVELDLGTMSHRRLRRKLDGYVAHAQTAHEGEIPALLFITTSDGRAETFLQAARRASVRPSSRLTIAACGNARCLDSVLTAACWGAAHNVGRSDVMSVLRR